MLAKINQLSKSLHAQEEMHMYHCRICFYLTGHQGKVFETIKKMAPLEHFSHEFLESGKPEKALTEKADVILVDLQGLDMSEDLHNLVIEKKKDAELILLAEKMCLMKYAA